MKFARIVFLIAGVYGLLVMLPQYFLESKIGRDSPPAITHPEFYYGFIGVTLAWQVVFIIISRDPVRYRALMIAAVLEKVGFVFALIVLFLQHRVSSTMLAPGAIDALLGVLFIAAFVKTRAVDNS
ncbi:MAG TPA: hypothetical protein VLA93_12910 [Pyrinomonadaceae bacterium]|nr:hypothetical protein [Pyrinomonadaceae bacterium]